MKLRPERSRGSCGIAGIMNKKKERFSGEKILNSISVMQDRSNGLGGGFSAYGIYPDYQDQYAFHIIYENEKNKRIVENHLSKDYNIAKGEAIPTREPKKSVSSPPILWRYFLDPVKSNSSEKNEEDFIVETVMEINRNVDGAFIVSSGKNMGIFKGVGFPKDIGRFYQIDKYEGHIWIAHGRFPTNTTGWWGGAHPLGILDWSIAHNGEISSYGTNRRFLLNYGYHCTLSTDSEIIAYLFDLLGRKHGLDIHTISNVLASPFWNDLKRLNSKARRLNKAIRITYSGALLNGPFSLIVGQQDRMVGLGDRLKLRPLVAGEDGDMLYMSSEESGIREVCPKPDSIWSPKAGNPVIGYVGE